MRFILLLLLCSTCGCALSSEFAISYSHDDVQAQYVVRGK
jgi:hypothetical protein